MSHSILGASSRVDIVSKTDDSEEGRDDDTGTGHTGEADNPVLDNNKVAKDVIEFVSISGYLSLK